jgi:hypothetical protein
MANRIFGDEFQQSWILKVVGAFENDVLMDEVRMLMQVRAQACDITGIEELDSKAKCWIFNALVMRQVQAIGERWLFDVALQSGPTGKTIFASDGELGVTQAELGVEDPGVRGTTETRMKFPDALGYCGSARGELFQQVPGLIFEMNEAWIRWEAPYRHDELPFVCPRSANYGQKGSSWKRIASIKVDFCPFRGPDAPFCAVVMLARKKKRAGRHRRFRKLAQHSAPVQRSSANPPGGMRYTAVAYASL